MNYQGAIGNYSKSLTDTRVLTYISIISSCMITAERSADVVNIEGPVGGGHRTFSYAVRSSLPPEIKIRVINPREQGTLPTQAIWEAFGWVYEFGGKGGSYQRVYEQLRGNSGDASLLLTLARLETKWALRDFGGVILADHAYASVGRGFLLQGDVRAERPYADGKSKVLVPVEEAKRQLVEEFGHPEELVDVVGFFIPKALIDHKDRPSRLEKFKDGKVEVGFFGTGASPVDHFRFLRSRLLPGLAPLIRQGRARLTVYTWVNKGLGEEIERQAAEGFGLKTAVNGDGQIDGNWQVRVIWGTSPSAAVERSVAAATETDYLVTMLGERIGWAAILPIAALPPINFNARANTEKAVAGGWVTPPAQTYHVSEFLAEELGNGASRIREQMQKAQEQIPVSGAEKAAGLIYQAVKERKEKLDPVAPLASI